MVRAFTDCPLPGATGVIAVELLAYDRNKYVTVRYAGEVEELKAGYLYRDDQLQRHLPAMQLCSLPTEVGGPTPTRRQAHAELMARRRRHDTSYTLWVGAARYPYRNLHDALRHFGRVYRDQDCTLQRAKQVGGTTEHGCLAESVNGQLTLYVQRRKHTSVLHKHHFRIGGF